ncbi:MAG: hypothetical protein KDK39_14510 [Leptospiraceae bacterium]|nr:hypothetical protein [Leptospiraceae bacterium]
MLALSTLLILSPLSANEGQPGNEAEASLGADTDAGPENSYEIIPIASWQRLQAGNQDATTPGVALAVKNDNELFIGSFQHTRLLGKSHMFLPDNEQILGYLRTAEFKRHEKELLLKSEIDQGSPYGDQTIQYAALRIYRQFQVPGNLYSINFLGDIKNRPWNTLLFFKSDSDRPVSGGLRTYQMGAARGYYFFRDRDSSFIFGGGIAVGDFGLKQPDGSVWPLIPIPLLRYEKRWQSGELAFDFLTGPNLSLKLKPIDHLQFTLDWRMDNYRDQGDILFEAIAWYRFFNESHKFGDFAGLGLGMKRDELGFDLSTRPEAFALQYTSAFATLDLGFLRISAGRTYHSLERHGDFLKLHTGKGSFADIQLLYKF